MTFLAFFAGVIAFIYLMSRISELQSQVRQLQKLVESARQGAQVSTPPAAAPVPMSTIPPTSNPAVHIAAAASPPRSPAMPNDSFDELSGGKWLGRIGIMALFIGVAFFLKYAFDTGLIGIEARIILGLAIGALFVGAGEYLHETYARYAQSSYLLMGGGIAILYASLYAAFSLYNLISQPVAFIAMIAVTALAVGLSVRHTSLPLALLAALGGFATPYLLSNGVSVPFVLFTYLMVLDGGLVMLGTEKKWPVLTYLSFIATGIQFFMWYLSSFTPDQLPLAFGFLTLFSALFLAPPVLHKIYGVKETREVDLMLAGFNAFGYFVLSYQLLNAAHHDMLWLFALALGGVYGAVAYLLYRLDPTDSLPSTYHMGIAAILVCIATALKLEHSWITLAWLLEAAFLYAIAGVYKRPRLQVLAMIVYMVALMRLLVTYMSHQASSPAFFNEYCALFLLAIAIAYGAAYASRRQGVTIGGSEGTSLAGFFVVLANILSVYILSAQVGVYFDQSAGMWTASSYGMQQDLANQKNTTISIVWTIYAVALIAVGFAARERLVRIMGLIFFFITAFKIFVDVWAFGELYRIVASIVFGAIALLASFMYVRYSERIKTILYEN